VSHPEADVTFTAVVLLVAVLALLFGGVLIAEPPIPLGPEILAMSPRVFPTLILAGTVLVASSFLVMKGMRGTLLAPRTTGDSTSNSTALYRQALFVVITVTCALLLTTLGFLTTMFLLMVSTSILVGNRSPFQILSISLILPLGFYIAVTHVLRTELPEADVVQRLLAPFLQLLPAI